MRFTRRIMAILTPHDGFQACSVDRQRERNADLRHGDTQRSIFQLDYLEPAVRGWFAKRICVLGAESQDHTLAKALAERLNTVWVEEYGREYSERKFARQDFNLDSDEFVKIALEQTRREDESRTGCQPRFDFRHNTFATSSSLASALHGHSQSGSCSHCAQAAATSIS